jgi:dTDP-4-dehydrorhamnose 3,5-epimerase
MKKNFKKIILTKLSSIKNKNGNLLHIIDKNNKNFLGFGEVYISWILPKKIKGWKKHLKMTMNLSVPVGKVMFIFCKNELLKKFKKYIIGENNYKLITVPPGYWFAFKNLSKNKSMVINFSNILHNDKEVEKLKLKKINFDWK